MSLFCLTGTPGVYISLAGLKDETRAHMKDFLGGEPVICVDNDAAVKNFDGNIQIAIPSFPKSERIGTTS